MVPLVPLASAGRLTIVPVGTSFQLHGDNLDGDFGFSCSFWRSGSRIITTAVLNASAACDAQSWRGIFLRAVWFPAGSGFASSTS